MPTMTKTALSDCSYPESTVYNIRDDIDATITRLKVLIDDEASLRKALRALFIKRREEALEQVRLANVHLDLVNEEEAAFCDDLMKVAVSANERLEGSGCAGSVRTGGIAMHTFPITNPSHGNDPSLNKVDGNRRMTPLSPKMLNSGLGTAPSQTPVSPGHSVGSMEPPKSPKKPTIGLINEPPRSPARSTRALAPPRSPARSIHAFNDEPTRPPAKPTRGVFEQSSKSPEQSTRGLFREPPRSPARSAYSFAPPRSPARSERFIVAMIGDEPKKAADAKTTNAKKNGAPSRYTESRRENSRYYGQEVEQKDARSEPNHSERTYDSYQYPRPDSRGSENHQEDRDDLTSIIRSEYTESDRYDDPRFNDQRRGTRDDGSRRHDSPTSVSSRVQSSRYGPRDDQGSYGRGLRVGVDTASMYSPQTDHRPLPPAAVFDDRSTRDDPVLSSRFSMSTTAISVQPHLGSQRKKSPTEPVPELKPRQLTYAEMYKLGKVSRTLRSQQYQHRDRTTNGSSATPVTSHITDSAWPAAVTSTRDSALETAAPEGWCATASTETGEDQWAASPPATLPEDTGAAEVKQEEPVESTQATSVPSQDQKPTAVGKAHSKPGASGRSWADIAKPIKKPPPPAQNTPAPAAAEPSLTVPVAQETVPEAPEPTREEPTTVEAPTWDDEPAVTQQQPPAASQPVAEQMTTADGWVDANPTSAKSERTESWTDLGGSEQKSDSASRKNTTAPAPSTEHVALVPQQQQELQLQAPQVQQPTPSSLSPPPGLANPALSTSPAPPNSTTPSNSRPAFCIRRPSSRFKTDQAAITPASSQETVAGFSISKALPPQFGSLELSGLGLGSDFVYDGQRNPYDNYPSQNAFAGRGALRQDNVKGLGASPGQGLSAHHGSAQPSPLTGQPSGGQGQGQYPGMGHMGNTFYYNMNMNPYGYHYPTAFTSFPMYPGAQTPPHGAKPGGDMNASAGLGTSGNSAYSAVNSGHLQHTSGGFDGDTGPNGNLTYHPGSSVLPGDFRKGLYTGAQNFLGATGTASSGVGANCGAGNVAVATSGGGVGSTASPETACKGYGGSAASNLGPTVESLPTQAGRSAPGVNPGGHRQFYNRYSNVPQSQGYPQQQGNSSYYPNYQRW